MIAHVSILRAILRSRETNCPDNNSEYGCPKPLVAPGKEATNSYNTNKVQYKVPLYFATNFRLC